MKFFIALMLTVGALQAQAGDGWKQIIPIIVGGIIDHNRPAPYPGPGYPPPPGNYPGYPSGPVTCTAGDRGWEEHSGGHYSCGECLSYHGSCVETCRSVDVECRAEGRDAYGRVYSAFGRGYDRWQAESDAMRNCQYNAYGARCYIVTCNQRQNIVSQRNCR